MPTRGLSIDGGRVVPVGPALDPWGREWMSSRPHSWSPRRRTGFHTLGASDITRFRSDRPRPMTAESNGTRFVEGSLRADRSSNGGLMRTPFISLKY